MPYRLYIDFNFCFECFDSFYLLCKVVFWGFSGSGFPWLPFVLGFGFALWGRECVILGFCYLLVFGWNRFRYCLSGVVKLVEYVWYICVVSLWSLWVLFLWVFTLGWWMHGFFAERSCLGFDGFGVLGILCFWVVLILLGCGCLLLLEGWFRGFTLGVAAWV